MGAVLHHLIGRTRWSSAAYARQCLANCMTLLKPGGHLLLFEPTIGPRFAMASAFWIKKVVTRLTDRRIDLAGCWINIGQPVVSYYTEKQLMQFIDGLRDTTVVGSTVVDESRFAIIRRKGLGIILEKGGAGH
ncbi:MAG: hypothetical protein IH878_10485 [Gemmatimonadetes bacterium]|nr:hypothetical protein [Gemmatimonadota bacterium]